MGALITQMLPGSVPQFQQYLASITTAETAHLNSVSNAKPDTMDLDEDDEDDVKPKMDEPSCVILGPGPPSALSTWLTRQSIASSSPAPTSIVSSPTWPL